MNAEETLTLKDKVQAAFPQQPLDEFTPDAWHAVLGELDLLECLRAVKDLAGRQTFCCAADIRKEVMRIRNERLARTVVPAPPAEVADVPGQYQAMVRAATARIASGHDPQRAIAGIKTFSEPTDEYREARAALGPDRHRKGVDKRNEALEQAEEYRAIRNSLRNAEHMGGEAS